MLSLFTFWLRDDDIDRIRVVGTLTALNLQLSSFKLFMLGHTVASGSLFCQVLEGVSLAFLFSVQELPFLHRFQADQSSARHAVRDLRSLRRNVFALQRLRSVLASSRLIPISPAAVASLQPPTTRPRCVPVLVPASANSKETSMRTGHLLFSPRSYLSP